MEEGVAEIELDLLGDLVAAADAEPEAVVVGDEDRAVAVVDRRPLVADAGAQRQVAVEAVLDAGRDEMAASYWKLRLVKAAPVSLLTIGMLRKRLQFVHS